MKTRILGLTVFAGALLLLAGCTTKSIFVQPQTGGPGYIIQSGADGWVAYLDKDLPTVHKAAAAALKDLKMKPMEHRSDKLSGLTTSEFADGEKMSIQLKRLDAKSTKVMVEVGALNPEKRVRSIFAAMVNNL